MKRSLTAFDLDRLGIGAIIGTGIFALTGHGGGGEQSASATSKLETPVLNFIQSWMQRRGAVVRPAGRGTGGGRSRLSWRRSRAVLRRFVMRELAAMIPVSGSAYTYSYATLGEIVAWIIGWDLILEYAVGQHGGGGRLVGVFREALPQFGRARSSRFGLVTRFTPPRQTLVAKRRRRAPRIIPPPRCRSSPGIRSRSICRRFFIVAAVTVLLIYGIRESARANTVIVIIKVAVVVFFIAFGAFMVNPPNWHPFLPNGFTGVMSGAAIVFFAFIGFDAVSTTAEETKNPQRDLPIGMIASLAICTLLYVLMSGVLTGIKKYTVYLGDSAAVATAFAGNRGRWRWSARARWRA